MAIYHQARTCSFIRTQHFISIFACNFCSRMRPFCLSNCELPPLHSSLEIATAVSGFTRLSFQGIRYPGC